VLAFKAVILALDRNNHAEETGAILAGVSKSRCARCLTIRDAQYIAMELLH
jgi:hypothetical protein